MHLSDWTLFGLFFLALFVLIGLAELVRHLLHASSEVTRKSVHIFTGLLVATTPFVFARMYPMVVLAIFFIVFNYFGVKTEMLKGMHGTQRPTYGTVFYPVSFLILLVFLWEDHKVVFVASMLILALSDAVAAIVGENLRRPHKYRLATEKKSVEGSVAMFLVTLVLTILCLIVLGDRDGIVISIPVALWIATLVAMFATVCEAVSAQGSDNLTVPLGAAFVMHYMLTHVQMDQVGFTVGVGLALIVAFGSVKARFLDASGAAITFVLATVIFGVGRWVFGIPILTFFILSSVLSQIGQMKKAKLADGIFEKSGVRDFGQVFANGGIAGILVLVCNYVPDPLLYILYVASLAAVTADTWATELGVLSRAVPRSIVSFKKVPIGSSGGVTVVGTLGGLLGAIVVTAASWLVGSPGPESLWTPGLFLLVVIAGLLASLIDSVLGATVQAQFHCPVCDKVTEKKLHCSETPTAFIRGVRLINNDVVNVACSFSGAGLAFLGVTLIR